MPEFDVDALRSRFPALAIEQDGRPVALFDGPGGTQVPDTVIEAGAHYYRTSNANHEGPFLTSRRSDAVVAEAHAALADLLNAADPAEIKLGANMTTLTMHLSRSIAASLQPGDTIVVTSLDHEANVGPWRTAAADRGLNVRTVDIRPDDVTLDVVDNDAGADLDRPLEHQDHPRHEVRCDLLQPKPDAHTQSTPQNRNRRQIDAHNGHQQQKRRAEN